MEDGGKNKILGLHFMAQLHMKHIPVKIYVNIVLKTSKLNKLQLNLTNVHLIE